ncbi:MAG TPA: glycosyltransferase family A protein [Candidatus Acidoferrales bacterium]|nr:glycosyltransferase family A protein [Candidatus Acidoferrales bacterium]
MCVCTFQRPMLLKRLLGELENQHTRDRFTYSIVVADNDGAQSASEIVGDFAAKSRIASTYCFEPHQNIALARNKALENAKGEFVAFIDDDEFPAYDWLLMLLGACEDYQAEGVLGPVRPHFEEQPPRWIIRGGFCERQQYETGRVMKWSEGRTGNVLFRRRILSGIRQAFRPEFGSGGEDVDFFRRMAERGYTFVWCNDAVVYEIVPPARWKRSYMLKRAMLRGRAILKHPTGRARLLAKSVVAVPLYCLALPGTLILGQHWFMKYAIKLFDHLGRLLAFVGINPFSQRDL